MAKLFPALFTLAFAVAAALLPHAAAAAGTTSAKAPPAQRYEVVNTTMLASGQQVPVTLLVDTVTGKTWILSLNNHNLPLWLAIPLYTNMESYSGNKSLRPSPD